MEGKTSKYKIGLDKYIYSHRDKLRYKQRKQKPDRNVLFMFFKVRLCCKYAVRFCAFEVFVNFLDMYLKQSLG